MKKSQKHTEKIEKEKQGLKVEIQSSLIALQHTKSELHEIRDENVKLTKTLRVSCRCCGPEIAFDKTMLQFSTILCIFLQHSHAIAHYKSHFFC